MLRYSCVRRGVARRTSVLLFTRGSRASRAPLSHQTSQTAVEGQIPFTRNIGIVAHIDAGKTTTTERMLYYAGVLKRLGDVDSGTTTTDFMKEEMDRGITIQSAAVSLRWRDHPINLIDTPGHVDFTVEVERAMRVVDGVVALFDASAGVQAQSYTVLRQSRKFNVPVIAFLNKMDKYNANFKMSVESIREKLQVEPLLVQLPLHTADGSFEGVIDLTGMRTCRFSGKNGEDIHIQEILASPSNPSDTTGGAEDEHVVSTAIQGRSKLVAQLTRHDDQLLQAYMEQLDATDGDEAAAECQLPESDIRAAVRRATLSGDHATPLMPVLCGASRRDQGVQPLLDAVTDFLPSPAERAHTGYTRAGGTVALPPVSTMPTVPTIALAFKVTHAMNPKGQRKPLVFVRVYSGKITPRMALRNNTQNAFETVEKLYVMHANTPVEVPCLAAGQIGAVFLEKTVTGDTLYAPPAPALSRAKPVEGTEPNDPEEEVYTLEGIDSPPASISFSIEAATKHQVPLLEEALQELHREDPSLCVGKNDFGNVVVSGMGELHLEIVMSRLEHEYHVSCRLLRAIIEYRETISQPQRYEKLMGTYNELPYAECSLDLRPLLNADEKFCGPSASCSFSIDPDFEAAYVSAVSTGGGGGGEHRARTAREELRIVKSCFDKAVTDCSRLGPLAGMPLHGVAVVLTHFRKVGGTQLHEKAFTVVSRSLLAIVLRGTLKQDLTILEPVMEVEIHLSEPEFIGSVVSSLNERKAMSIEVLEDGRSVRATVAMRNVVRYTMELRKAVKGHANLFTKMIGYQVVESKSVLARILKNLGIVE